MPAVQVLRFAAPRSPITAPVIARINRFLQQNASITLLDVSVQTVAGASRGNFYTVVLTVGTGFSARATTAATGGAKYQVVELVGSRQATLTGLVQAWLAANPTVIPVFVTLTNRSTNRYNDYVRALVFYTSSSLFSDAGLPLASAGVPQNDILAAAAGVVSEVADPARAQPSVTNRGLTTWTGGNPSLLVKSASIGLSAWGAIGMNYAQVTPPVAPPAPPTPPVSYPPCPCAFRLESMVYTDSTAAGTRTLHLDPVTAGATGNQCFTGTLLDIVKASLRGYLEVTNALALCLPGVWNIAWPSAEHFDIAVHSSTDDGFIAQVGIATLPTSCATPAYLDGVLVLHYSRCGTPAPGAAYVAAGGSSGAGTGGSSPSAAAGTVHPPSVLPPPAPFLPTFTVSSPTVLESAGTASFTVTRTDGGLTANFHIYTANGTAIAGTDYTAVDAYYSFTAVQARVITVPITNRGGAQGDRTFTLNVGYPS